MLASVHMCRMVLVLRARLKVLVRYVRPSGPMCLRCLMLMPSGPVELFFLLFRMAADISDVVSINVVYELVCQSSYLFCLKCVGPC